MRKSLITLTSIFAIFLVFVAVAYAGVAEPADTYTGTGSSAGTAFGTTDPENLELNSGGLSTCGATRTIYLRWNLVGVDRAAGPNTSLVLTINNAQASNTGQITLYQVTDDNWDEANLTQNTAPALGAVITSVPNPAVPSGTVVFTGQALADWIDENSSFVGLNDPTAGNDKVSFGLQITGCSGFSNPSRFDSRNKSSGTPPALVLYDPNSVTLRTFHSDNPAVSPVIWGGAAIALLAAVAGIIVARRRRLAN